MDNSFLKIWNRTVFPVGIIICGLAGGLLCLVAVPLFALYSATMTALYGPEWE